MTLELLKSKTGRTLICEQVTVTSEVTVTSN